MTAALLVGPSLQVQAAKNDVILVEKGVALAVVCVPSGYAVSALFEITSAVQPDKMNTLVILCERTEVNELGVGGLLGPVMIYRDK